jgi:hypothetical protein
MGRHLYDVELQYIVLPRPFGKRNTIPESLRSMGRIER